MGKVRVYRHENKPGKYVVDPPGMHTNLWLCRSGEDFPDKHNRGDAEWMFAGGKVVEGYAEAIHYATELGLRHRWFEQGKKEGMILC